MAKKVAFAGLPLALLLGIVVTYYYVYISEQESYVIERNFRLLALWSDELSHTVDDYKRHLEYITSATAGEDESVECGKKNSRQGSPPPQCPENVPAEDLNKKCDDSKDSDEKIKCAFQQEFEKLNEDIKGKLTSLSICPEFEIPKKNKLVNDQPRIKAQLSSKDNDLLRLIYEKKKGKSSWVCTDTIEVDLSIVKTINHLIKIDKNVFSDVIVFDSETGAVHFQKDHYLFRIDNVRDLVTRRPDAGGESAFFSIFSDNPETTGVRNGNKGSSPSPLNDLLQNPTHRRITIGDVPYELFTQPVVLPELTIDKQTEQVPVRLILTGLMKTEQFHSESRAIPHTWLLACLFFVLLGLVSLPVIHLGLMDAREPLRPMTMVAILFTCVVGTAMITLFFLDTTWLSNVRHELDNQLKTTANNIKEKFGMETRNALRLLRKYDESEELEDDFSGVLQGENCPDSDHNMCAEENRKYGKSASDRWVARKKYPYRCDEAPGEFCDLFFWVGPKKNSRMTWNTGSKFHLETSNVSLAHRDYVNRILDPDPESSLWRTRLNGRPVPFYAQPLHSLGTGKHLVIVSMESSQHPESSDGNQEKWVAAIEMEFQFLKSVAIPKGTGFAVIEDEGGKVLFHSDANRNLWENFFEETDDNAELTANVFSRTPGKFEGKYWGKGHAFYSTPLPDVPWSLVVFRNKELFRTTNFEALLLASALFAVYIVIWSIVLAVIWLFLIFLSITKKFRLILSRITKKICAKCIPETLHWRYAFAVISLLLLFSALPMGIFFKAGTDREMLLAMKYNLITLGHKLRQAPGLDLSQIQATGNCTETGSAEDFPCLERGIHLNVLANTELSVTDKNCSANCSGSSEPSLLDKFHRFIRKNSLSRLSNRVSIETLGLLRNQPDEPDRTFYWEDSPSSPVSLTFQATHKQSGFQPTLITLTASPLPDTWWSAKGFPDKRHVVSFIVFIAGVLVMVLVPLFIVRRIFPILPQPSSNPLKEAYEGIWQELPPEQKTTLYNLAKNGFAHAENPDLGALSQRGLINAQFAPRLFNKDFKQYVLNAAQRDELETQQRKSQSQWQVWKWPLVIVFLVLGLGLLLTQEEFSNAVVLMLSLLPVLLPTLSELTGSPQKAGKAN